ncbi:sugar-binding protein, partial [Pseudomonas syringae]|uniref:RHS repeat domain-containing protein n=1 Tax=Pseudomonas syringae TaxID=317 RepID=UPI001F439A71
MPTPTVHSNAFNFLSFVQAGVDPRTGQYSCSISLPELKANHLCGPIVPLSLGFSPMNSRDTGFGKGWGLQLSHFDPVTSILSLSTGETFRIDGPQSAPTVPERKIDSFHFSFEADDQYRVVHKSGLVEILGKILGSDAAWVTQMHSAEGHRVDLSYTLYGGEALLQQISDDYGTLLSVERNGTTSTAVHLHPDKGPNGTPLASFNLSLNNGELVSIALPTTNQASWRFVYELFNEYLCITELRTPLGGHELISYDPLGHQFPQNHYPSLPRVERHEQRPGFSQPAVERRFSYSSENFLGFDASGLVWDEDGLDNLYQADPAYTYSSTEMLWVQDQALRSTTRTFNNFHLLTEETVTQNDNVLTTQTTYHSTPGQPFLQQPAQCQLPDAVLKIWYHPSTSSQTHEETTRTTFDEFGNLLTQENPDGTLETSRYYLATGGDGCPPDPHGFVRNLQDKTITPAPDALGEAPVLCSAYRYALQTGVGAGSTPDWLAISGETLLQVQGASETELQRTTFTYIDEPANRYLHGRKLQETQTLNGQSSITDYAYQRTKSARAEESVQHTVISLSTDFDDVHKSYTLEHSLLNGQPLLNRDDNDVEIAYRYDALGRVTEETVAPGSEEFKAVRKYDYVLSASDGQQAEQTVTNVKGIKTRTLMDGNNRVIEELRQGADESQPEAYKKIYSASYDVRGLLVADTVSDWLLIDATLRELPLTSTYQYDDWGEQCSVTGPDGIERHKVEDPVERTTTEWQAEMGKTVTLNNLFGKPDSIERLDASNQRISLESIQYDGLGRTFIQVDALGNLREFSYDAFDRLTGNRLPGDAQIERAYAGHSRDDLPVSISVDGVLLGEQRFDGLGRMTASTVGGRLTRFEFIDGRLQPHKVHTPSKEVIDYLYQPQLGENPIQRKLLNSTADYTYDPLNARLISSKEQDQELERDYFANGELKQERRVQGGKTYTADYQYSLNGRLLSYTDVVGATQTWSYDSSGRLESTRVGTLTSTFIYNNAHGRIESIGSVDSAQNQNLHITLKYDTVGREVLRSFALPDGTKQTLAQAYDAADHLQQRTLSEGNTLLRDETFEYDPRGRLERYTVTGALAPQDPLGKQIQSQTFTFDALDNFTEVTTVFAEGSNTAQYEYSDDDPTQLRVISNNHKDYPERLELDYDANGNLTMDEAGRTIKYDALGRLLSVSATADIPAVDYGYDALDSLTNSRSTDGSEQRFYRDGQLANQLRGEEQRSFSRAGDQLLAEHQGGNNAGTQLLATDARKTVLAEVSPQSINDLSYSAYGHQSSAVAAASRSGFNGELRESATGWYLLGQGYRAYNPVLMRFHSPDSLSPFGDGGLNAYAYCVGDPVNYLDPDGHIPWWLGLAAGIAATVLTAGLAASFTAVFVSVATAGAVASATSAVASVTGVISLGSAVGSALTKGAVSEGLGWLSLGTGIVAGVG